jgi:hypothetical protein
MPTDESGLADSMSSSSFSSRRNASTAFSFFDLPPETPT